MTHIYVTHEAPVNVNFQHAFPQVMRHGCSMRKNVPDVLKERLTAKLSELGMSAREASLAALNKPDAIRAILAGHMPGLDRLDAIAEVLGTTSDWLLGREEAIERSFADGQPIRPEALRRLPKTLPIYGSALGADMEFGGDGGVVVKVEQTEVHMSSPIDYMARPIGVTGRPDLYVVEVSGHSMEPRYDSGRRVLVDPRRSPGVGDDVVVQLRSPTFDGEEVCHVLIKQLVRRKPGMVVLRQFNPDFRFEVPNEQVKAVHRVMPWDEALGF
ncbi:LexA family transcriptional regulator [Sphingomonas pseudosanguinis]|uniref:Phage repressor protein C with HTH and peptisase S24 domain n=1 Tax=Sphingomonas pseudosanguinis TaxID=413712 RepID=A0A7W6F1P6_9SPHN|nr:helix-turn-helix transcriptional regulator [Sphingomonas pseudosanguinis]MBB3877917.1 phage repressor protein C with HTH and peptisase S24 domain [Sphingomonas pseudosanguinis]MBN3537789.1 helix-turn-helix transcriptional regulator [Sphingomonas pseudosanguinis]